MKINLKKVCIAVLFVNFIFSSKLYSQETHNKGSVNLENAFIELHKIAKNEVIINAVVKHNKGLSPEMEKIDNTAWKKLSATDPMVLKFSKNPVADYLKKELRPYVTEAFISGADGKKIAFLTKTSSWDHSQSPKHKIPMSGKDWQGEVELDESTGVNQIQIAVPVVANSIPIGSIVLGISIVRYKYGGK